MMFTYIAPDRSPIYDDVSRNNKDVTLNRFGIAIAELCCVFDILMLNGRMGDDKLGEFACTANGGKSVVDYILTSTPLFCHAGHFEVGGDNFSDHFPLKLKLRISDKKEKSIENSNLKTAYHYKWDESCRETFLEQFNTHYTDFERMSSELTFTQQINAFMM
ncbi:hypothetical protein MAR_006731, partial [Mya arenaria]